MTRAARPGAHAGAHRQAYTYNQEEYSGNVKICQEKPVPIQSSILKRGVNRKEE
jgi:hypothetical protein